MEMQMKMPMAMEVKLFGLIKSVVVPMVTICAWCPDGETKTKQAQAEGLVVSHGMCQDCKAIADRQFEARR
jgi:hypothetical protein